MTVTYRKSTGANGISTVVAFDARRDQPVLVATSTHPHYERIVAGLEGGDDSVVELFDVVTGIQKSFANVTERITWNGSNILWDGDVINTMLSRQVEQALKAGDSRFEALAKFWEKLESNPNEHSKKMAYEWLASHDFKITADGDVVGYKGVTASGYSTRMGHAFVDGKEYKNAYIPNEDGAVVTMPRSEVAHDPNAACHTGLHIGDWSFASRFGSTRTKRVHINPRDIVSVPGHANKMRVCRYQVIADAVQPVETESPIITENEGDVIWNGVGYRS